MQTLPSARPSWDIAYGRAGGDGPYAIFAATMRYKLEPQIVAIDMSC
jgi:hypothetical protein